MYKLVGLLLFALSQIVTGQVYPSYGGHGFGYGYGCGIMQKPVPAPSPTPSSEPLPCVHSNNTEVQTWVNGGEDMVYHLYYNELYNDCDMPLTQHFIYANPFDSIQQYWNVEIYANASAGLGLGNGTGVFMLPEWAQTWGVGAGQKMNFGWIADGPVSFSDSRWLVDNDN